jgi:hypothetical protein
MRIVADGISMADTTDGSFSIEAAEPDKYEPNDDSIHSTILTFGDTAKKCVAMGYGGQQEPQTRFCPSSMMWCEGWKDSLTNYIDPDWYKVTTSASKLIQVRAIPGLDSNKYNDTWKTPKVTIMNTSGEIVASNDVMMQNGFVRFNSGSGGTFYCIVNHNPADKVLMPHERGWYFDYSLVAKIVADLEVLDIGPDSYVAKNGSYEMAMSGDASNIDISITAKTPAPGTISLAKLPIDSEVVSLRGQGTGLALISIEASSAISSALQQASISIPYNQITAGDSESKIEARYFNDSTGEWETIPFAIDAQTNTVTVSTTHFSIYGLFITDIKTPAIQKKPVIATGVSLNRAQGNGSLVLNYSLTQPGAVRIVLYGLNGKKYANIINNRLHPSGVFTKTVSVSQAVRRQVLILEAELAGKKMTQLLTIVR